MCLDKPISGRRVWLSSRRVRLSRQRQFLAMFSTSNLPPLRSISNPLSSLSRSIGNPSVNGGSLGHVDRPLIFKTKGCFCCCTVFMFVFSFSKEESHSPIIFRRRHGQILAQSLAKGTVFVLMFSDVEQTQGALRPGSQVGCVMQRGPCVASL